MLVFRGTPLIVQIFFIYFGVNLLFGVTLIPTTLDFGLFTLDGAVFAGILALGINEGAYMREIIRAGIDAIDKGQMEAARSLGMTLRPGDAAHRPAAGGAGDRAAARQRVQQHDEDDVAAVFIGVYELFADAEIHYSQTLQARRVLPGRRVLVPGPDDGLDARPVLDRAPAGGQRARRRADAAGAVARRVVAGRRVGARDDADGRS